jgi:hypothetical protein
LLLPRPDPFTPIKPKTWLPTVRKRPNFDENLYRQRKIEWDARFPAARLHTIAAARLPRRRAIQYAYLGQDRRLSTLKARAPSAARMR